MSAGSLLESLAEALRAVDELIKEHGGRGLVIGGVAVGLVSVPRFTGDVDISLGILPFEEEAVARSRVLSAAGASVRVPTPEDLVIMKAVAHRAKDFEDIRTILEVHPKIDRKRVEYWVRQFADALEM